jgi:multiple sugar transport system substrate-binding protein
MSTFQIVLTGVFIFFIVAGVLVFAGIGGFGGSTTPVGTVVIWGTYDAQIVDDIIHTIGNGNKDFDGVSYVEKDPQTFDQELAEALASGRGPDLFFVSEDTILRHKDKIIPISYTAMAEREFKDTFIQEGELFLDSAGILALPLTVDPLVMYWNRSLYNNAGVSKPPQFWDEFLTTAIGGVLTKRGESGLVLQSALGMGEYQNILHSKALLSSLMMQAGSGIVRKNSDGSFTSDLTNRLSDGQSPSENALRFYTDFANPAKATYSWNRALPEAQKAFVGGTLATYFGFASELSSLRQQNPNLNFDVALLPQVRSGATKLNFSSIIGLATAKASPNPSGAMSIAFALTNKEVSDVFAQAFSLPSVRRDSLAVRPADSFKSIFTDAALRSQAWFDPNSVETETIFKNMIESVVSGELRIADAVRVADNELTSLLRK